MSYLVLALLCSLLAALVKSRRTIAALEADNAFLRVRLAGGHQYPTSVDMDAIKAAVYSLEAQELIADAEGDAV